MNIHLIVFFLYITFFCDIFEKIFHDRFFPLVLNVVCMVESNPENEDNFCMC